MLAAAFRLLALAAPGLLAPFAAPALPCGCACRSAPSLPRSCRRLESVGLGNRFFAEGAHKHFHHRGHLADDTDNLLHFGYGSQNAVQAAHTVDQTFYFGQIGHLGEIGQGKTAFGGRTGTGFYDLAGLMLRGDGREQMGMGLRYLRA